MSFEPFLHKNKFYELKWSLYFSVNLEETFTSIDWKVELKFIDLTICSAFFITNN